MGLGALSCPPLVTGHPTPHRRDGDESTGGYSNGAPGQSQGHSTLRAFHGYYGLVASVNTKTDSRVLSAQMPYLIAGTHTTPPKAHHATNEDKWGLHYQAEGTQPKGATQRLPMAAPRQACLRGKRLHPGNEVRGI